jgi:hypothetical protein
MLVGSELVEQAAEKQNGGHVHAPLMRRKGALIRNRMGASPLRRRYIRLFLLQSGSTHTIERREEERQ